VIRAIAISFIILIFIAGLASGVAVDRLWLLPRQPGPPMPPEGAFTHRPPPELFFEHLSRSIDLDDGQRQKVRAILEESERQAHEVMEASRPRLDVLRDETRAKLLSVFTEPQRARFLELEQQAMRPPGPPARPGHPPPHHPPPHHPPPHHPPPGPPGMPPPGPPPGPPPHP
jgi:Spy/CpxP family protein refolding chaperone